MIPSRKSGAPPKKEQDPGAAQGAVLYKRLSELGQKLSLPPKSEVLWIDDHCFMRIARYAADNLKGARTLLVGPQACLNAIERTRRPAQRRLVGVGATLPTPDLHYTLLTSEHGAAFGDDRKVAEAIRSIVDEEAPPFLFVITTCMNEVLGLDVEGIVKEMGDLSPTHVTVVQVDTFSGRGKEEVLGGWLTTLVDVMQVPDERDESRLNLLGANFPPDIGEIDQVLRAAGYPSIVAIPSNADRAAVESAPSAAGNIVLREAALDLAREMERRFGTPFVHAELTVGLETTRAWYESISTFLGRELDTQDRYGTARAQTERVASGIAGLRFAMGELYGRSMEVFRFLIELGLEPVLVAVEDLKSCESEHVDAILRLGKDPMVSRMNRFAVRDLLRDDPPDILIGLEEMASDLGILNVPIPGSFGWAGYQATSHLLGYLERYLVAPTPGGLADEPIGSLSGGRQG